MNKFAFILMLLAAILVPAMLGYVKKAQAAQERYEDTYSSYSDEYYADEAESDE